MEPAVLIAVSRPIVQLASATFLDTSRTTRGTKHPKPAHPAATGTVQTHEVVGAYQLWSGLSERRPDVPGQLHDDQDAQPSESLKAAEDDDWMPTAVAQRRDDEAANADAEQDHDERQRVRVHRTGDHQGQVARPQNLDGHADESGQKKQG